MEKITYEITDPDGKEWETGKVKEVRKALMNGSRAIENKLIISHSGATFVRIFTSTPVYLDYFREEGF